MWIKFLTEYSKIKNEKVAEFAMSRSFNFKGWVIANLENFKYQRPKEMKRLEKVYEGKAKILYATEDPDLMIQFFKDDASALTG